MAGISLARICKVTALLVGQVVSYVDISTRKVIVPGASSYNGLNLVPQMGWDNWNAFQCNVNESLLLNTAQAMVDYGLRDLGYQYIVLDDCWSIGRNSSGYLVENRESSSYLTSSNQPR